MTKRWTSAPAKVPNGNRQPTVDERSPRDKMESMKMLEITGSVAVIGAGFAVGVWTFEQEIRPYGETW